MSGKKTNKTNTYFDSHLTKASVLNSVVLKCTELKQRKGEHRQAVSLKKVIKSQSKFVSKVPTKTEVEKKQLSSKLFFLNQKER